MAWPRRPNSLRPTSTSAPSSKATELKKRIWFTLGALIVYRLGTYIPVPGVDRLRHGRAAAAARRRHPRHVRHVLAAARCGRMTVFALNIMPYISASIIVQLMSAAIPSLEALKKEGESGPQEAQPVHPLPDRR